MTWSIALVRWWTRAYTAGLPPMVRDGRRAEIESDLWESVHDPSGDPQMALRLLFGLLDDLRWRAGLLDEHSRAVYRRLTIGTLACIALWRAAVVMQLGPRLLESSWAYPIVDSLHVLGLTMFLGLTVMLDARLMGISLRRVPISELVEMVTPWTAMGALVAISTGLLTFLADPSRYIGNALFVLKMAALAVALANSLVFHLVVYARAGEWDLASVPPRHVRAAACASLVLWSVVVVSGRLLAYRWF